MKIIFYNINESLELVIVQMYRATFFAYDQLGASVVQR